VILDQPVEGVGASVVVERSPAGAAVGAYLDLAALPRLEPLLLGRPAAQVPPLVERLCGVCPAAHHLAGVAALEALAGFGPLPAEARRVRRLLHYGSALTMHALGFLAAGQAEAAAWRALGKLAQAAAGSPGHFPASAQLGGVAAPMAPDAAAACLAGAPAALELARTLFAWAQAGAGGDGPGGADAAPADRAGRLGAAGGSPGGGDGFGGADVALVDQAGRLDPLGQRLRAVGPDGAVLVAGAPASQWDALVAERRPGAAASRPHLLVGGVDGGYYRVGPVAQLRVADPATPAAAALAAEWRERGGGALAARAVLAAACVEAIAALAAGPRQVGAPLVAPAPDQALDQAGRCGVGWVDGARGLLVHRYRVDAAGAVDQALILTPTAQNEYWLSRLLLAAVKRQAGEPGLELAIREADPCLPCVAAPPGRMGVVVRTIAAEG
jgi:NAD-reducing hydrogenase large subunit